MDDPTPEPEPIRAAPSSVVLAGIAVAVVAVVVAVVAAVQLTPGPDDDATGRASAPAPVVSIEASTAPPAATPRPSATLDSPPLEAIDPVAVLACRLGVAPIGTARGSTWSGSPETLGPRQALDAFLRTDAPFAGALPAEGYTAIVERPSWVVFVSRNVARPVAVVVAQHLSDGRWAVTRFAACDAADFDPAIAITDGTVVWVDGSGSRVQVSTLRELPDCYGATMLRLEGRLYVRDPTGEAYDAAVLIGSYDPDAALPPTAVDTGYRDGERRLFRAAGDLAVYVVTPSRVERWPRVRGDDVVRTDCN